MPEKNVQLIYIYIFYLGSRLPTACRLFGVPVSYTQGSVILAWMFFLCFSHPNRAAKRAPSEPQESPRGPKRAPRDSQESPRTKQDDPKGPRQGPIRPQDVPLCTKIANPRAQYGPKMNSNCLELVPLLLYAFNCPGIRPRGGQKGPKRTPNSLAERHVRAPMWPQDGFLEGSRGASK